MTELILIRHGETDWNRQGRYTGQADVPLNAEGLAQAKALAESTIMEGIEAIYASDLRRAMQSARPLAEAAGLPVQADHRLREINQGEWEGMLFEEIRSRFAAAWSQRVRRPLEVAPPGGETVGEVRQRVLAALNDILAAHPDGRVAIVSHGLALALIKVHLSDQPIETVWSHIPGNAEPERVIVEVT